jgi:pimeloyl-ACP methyl ester carboxylesterase
MPVAEVNAHPLYFEDSGGREPSVVFSHGFLMDHEMFAPQVDALSGEFRTITWDQRGFGQTPADGPFTCWDSADDVLALLDHLGIEQAVLVGMSQGGFLSLRAALTAPERVKALVLIDTQAGTEDPAARPAFEAINAEWNANGPAAVQEALAAILLGSGNAWAPWFAKWEAAPKDSLDEPLRCLFDREDITDRLDEIPCPAIVFHGDADQAIPLAKAEILAGRLPGSESLVVVAGGPHACNLSHPDEVNGPLIDFLRRWA